jgi:hypothetical protein
MIRENALQCGCFAHLSGADQRHNRERGGSLPQFGGDFPFDPHDRQF